MGLEGPITHGVANNNRHHWSPPMACRNAEFCPDIPGVCK
jgi:hypothetical protein